jgi:DNA primase
MLNASPWGIEEFKGLNMVDFLSRYYGLDFSKGGVEGAEGYSGDQYRCLSPFKEESNASFFVREVEGHWLFKDFCSGHGGSLIDFVLLKEGFGEVCQALSHIEHLLGGKRDKPGRDSGGQSFRLPLSSPTSPASIHKTYNVKELYHSFGRNDVSRCRDYLLGRGINEEAVDALCGQELLVHNEYKGESYCCFAVFNAEGQLRCLDNHQIDGEKKFVLGHKHPFSLDWSQLPLSESVFVTESVMDYLSLKTIEGFDFRGVALLGNVLNFSSELFRSAHEVVSALDGDSGGFRAFLDLEERFSERVIRVYDFGDSKDANEYLQKRKQRQRGKRLSAEDKLSLYRDFQSSGNKSEVALRWGINRSYMYDVVKECEELILSGFSARRAGRKPSGQPETLAEARQRLKELEEENRRLDEERERYWVRNEFMKVRLKWAEREADELGDEDEVESQPQHCSGSVSKNRKKHLKKKRRKKS